MVMTIVCSVLTSICVLIISDMIKIVWINPVHEYRQIKRQIASDLVMYEQCYGNPTQITQLSESGINTYEKASVELRQRAADLEGFIQTIIGCKPFIPGKKELHEASLSLIGLSNSLYVTEERIYDKNIKETQTIKKMLNLK